MEVTQYQKAPPEATPSRPKRKRVKPWVIAIAVGTAVSAGATYWFYIQSQTPPPPATTSVVEITSVTALGRLEPQGEVIKLSVANAQDSRVNQLLVEEGDRVPAGEIIAVLQGLDQKQAALEEAQKNVAIYRAKLAQIAAGEAKEAEITAQRANIARFEAEVRTATLERQAQISDAQAELSNATTNYRRYQALHDEGAVTTAELDDRRETYTRAQARLNEAQARLDQTVSTLQEQIAQERAMLAKLQEVRPVDLQEAQAELDYAIAQVKRIEEELDDYYVRVPVAGQILKINTHVGEQVNTSEGIVELGRTEQMYAIAEVYETDISQVATGQRAIVTSEHGGFDGSLQGTVEHIGLQIKKQDVLDADPAADKDARVVEVKVRLDPQDSHRVAGLTNLQVRVRIDVGSE
ncbi:MAG: HlyD family efflux transporter periplasmic adaptor subunit [Cyanophyceae cyanobacterium]